MEPTGLTDSLSVGGRVVVKVPLAAAGVCVVGHGEDSLSRRRAACSAKRSSSALLSVWPSGPDPPANGTPVRPKTRTSRPAAATEFCATTIKPAPAPGGTIVIASSPDTIALVRADGQRTTLHRSSGNEIAVVDVRAGRYRRSALTIPGSETELVLKIG